MVTGLTPALEYHVVNSLGWPDLRPLQREAVEPVRRGDDCLLLAPTAGGKTEAAVFPLLSSMADASWTGLSVLYLTPLRALLNNLHPRLTTYASWLGRTVGLWHGDVGAGERSRMLADPPDVLLTTPESLEAMLVSRRVDHAYVFAGVRAVVVDELHAFAGDDRGWHLQGVLERVQRLAGRRLQRIGLSATVGNPQELLAWLGGGTPPARATVVAPDLGLGRSPGTAPGPALSRVTGSAPGGAAPGGATAEPPAADVTLDYVGTIPNAATVIAALHRGEKRLAFCDSRAQAEELAHALRDRDVTVFVSHSSLSADERRRSEAAFAEARACVVVATSTLELGIDVGDLDRVIQLDAPRTVSSFLQRLGRTGRRAGTSRNTLFLATREDALLRAAGLLSLWGTGYVEPVVPPPHPRHIAGQQLLALALQEGRFGVRTWREWWPGAPLMDQAEQILDWQLAAGYLARDGDFAFVGQEAERRFGRRHFMDLLAVFTAPPEMHVIHGRTEIGTVSPLALTAALPEGAPRLLLLAGRTWAVTGVDWRTRIVTVVAETGNGLARWHGSGAALSLPLSRSMRDVLLGTDPPVTISRRAATALGRLRDERAGDVDTGVMVLRHGGDGTRWWTWAGTRANASLAAALDTLGLETGFDHEGIRSDHLFGLAEIHAAADLLRSPSPPTPAIDSTALDGLKFSAALPPDLAVRTLIKRMTDPAAALAIADGSIAVAGR